MTNPENQIVTQIEDTSFQYDRWRTAFLAVFLRVTAGLGLLLIIANISSLSGIGIFLFAAAYAALLIATFVPLPYRFKAAVLPAVTYITGAYALLQEGPWSNASLFLLAATLFATLLFDNRLDRWVFTVSLVTVVLIGTLNITGNLPFAATNIPQTGLTDWLVYAASYLALSLALLWSVNMFKTEFRSVASQFQSAIGALERERSDLEKRVEERTVGLVQKSDQLRAAAYIARQTAEIQELDTILKTVVNLITEQFSFYHAGIFLLNEAGDEVILVSASSEGGTRMVEKRHTLQVGTQGIVGFVAAQKRPRIALDVGTDAVFFNNPDLPSTRSEVALPLLIRNRVLGVLDIQSDQPMAFSREDIDVLQTLADQLAVAIDNARLLDETRAALMQIEALTAVRTREAWSQKTKEGDYSYTYTPLGVRTGKTSERTDQVLEIPITLRGQKIGTIAMARKDMTPWSKLDRDMINEVAYQTGLAIDNVRLVEEATQRAKQEQTVGELATRFSQAMDMDTLLQTAARELGQLADVAEVSVFIGENLEQASKQVHKKR